MDHVVWVGAADGRRSLVPVLRGSVCARFGRAWVDLEREGRTRSPGIAGADLPLAGQRALVSVRDRLPRHDQIARGDGASRDHRGVAAFWSGTVVAHDCGHHDFDLGAGRRRTWLARIRPAALVRPLRPWRRERDHRNTLGQLAFAILLHPRGRHPWTIVPALPVAGHRSLRRHGVALLAHWRKPVARHAFPRRRQQHQGHRALRRSRRNESRFSQRVSRRLADGRAVVDLCRQLPRSNAPRDAGSHAGEKRGVRGEEGREESVNGGGFSLPLVVST
jgi:hypothetical protein